MRKRVSAVSVGTVLMMLLNMRLSAGVDFTASPSSGCKPLVVTFTDKSTPEPTSWLWTFTGGSPSSATSKGPHQVTYEDPGSYTASLRVGWAPGGYLTKNVTITVNACSSIGGRVWLDEDMDGIQNPPYDHDVPGVTVRLYKNGLAIASTSTDQEGRYEFSGLLNGNYNIRFDPPGLRLQPEQSGGVGPVGQRRRSDYRIDSDLCHFRGCRQQDHRCEDVSRTL